MTQPRPLCADTPLHPKPREACWSYTSKRNKEQMRMMLHVKPPDWPEMPSDRISMVMARQFAMYVYVCLYVCMYTLYVPTQVRARDGDEIPGFERCGAMHVCTPYLSLCRCPIHVGCVNVASKSMHVRTGTYIHRTVAVWTVRTPYCPSMVMADSIPDVDVRPLAPPWPNAAVQARIPMLK